MNAELEDLFSGRSRPPSIPQDWLGEPLPDGQGWRWFNPQNRGDSVRFFRGDPQHEDAARREPFVLVTVNGQLLDREGQPTGESLYD